MIKKYVKKPIQIEAVRWDGENVDELYKFMNKHIFLLANHKLAIETIEGTMEAEIGDYIIKGVAGEFYPCRADIFHRTYEEV